MEQARYRIEVFDADGTGLGQFTNFKDLKFGKRLNNYGACEFTIAANDERASSLVALRRYTIEIWREVEGKEPDLKWAGEQVVRRGNLTNTANNWVTIYCYSFFERLNGRATAATQSYVSTAQELIAVSIIGGAFGMTSDVDESTLRDREYHSDNVMEAIINLSNLINGFDFEVNDQNTFVAREQIGIDRTDSVILEYGYNISSVSIEEDFSSPVNRAIVLGLPADSNEQIRVEAEDVVSQGIYGIREKVVVESNVSELETFDDKAEALLQKYKYPLFKISVEMVANLYPTISDFAIGDIVRIIVQYGIYDLDASYRVFEWQVDVEENNTEKLSLVLGQYTLEG